MGELKKVINCRSIPLLCSEAIGNVMVPAVDHEVCLFVRTIWSSGRVPPSSVYRTSVVRVILYQHGVAYDKQTCINNSVPSSSDDIKLGTGKEGNGR